MDPRPISSFFYMRLCYAVSIWHSFFTLLLSTQYSNVAYCRECQIFDNLWCNLIWSLQLGRPSAWRLLFQAPSVMTCTQNRTHAHAYNISQERWHFFFVLAVGEPLPFHCSSILTLAPRPPAPPIIAAVPHSLLYAPALWTWAANRSTAVIRVTCCT